MTENHFPGTVIPVSIQITHIYILEAHVGSVLYEIIAGRYHHGATVITSNKSLANWGELVGDNALMMAIIDRLLHHGEVFYLRGTSYRMKGREPMTLVAKPDFTVAVSNGKS